MPMLRNGRDLIAKLLANESGVKPLSNSLAYLWVGSSTGAVASTQDHLLSTGAVGKPMQATYPARSSGEVTWLSFFSSDFANFAWEEIGVKNSSTTSSGEMLQRLLSSLGTKPNTQGWELQLVGGVASST
jgi:hypothetical protein